jgi:phosphoglycolate phosphatase-like HAD superfamily hydrolase
MENYSTGTGSECRMKIPMNGFACFPVLRMCRRRFQFFPDVFLLAIATSKDYQSVHLLLNHWGLAQYFEQRNILDKDFAGSKREHLVRFHEEHHIPFSGMHFVDDKVSHLFTVQDLGVHAYLALWGFNTPREHAIAQKSGFRLLSLADLQGLGI